MFVNDLIVDAVVGKEMGLIHNKISQLKTRVLFFTKQGIIDIKFHLDCG